MTRNIQTFVITSFLILASQLAFAGSATWNLNPTNGDWNTAANWTPSTVPNGAADTATFDTTNKNVVALSSDVEVSSIVFNPGASSYTINAGGTISATALTLSGQGIVNNSGVLQNIFNANLPANNQSFHGTLFTGTSKAGLMIMFTNQNSDVVGSFGTRFDDKSSADHAIFTNEGDARDAMGTSGFLEFFDRSTGGYATVTNEPGFHHGGTTVFGDSSSAGNSTITCNGGIAGAPVGGLVSLDGTATFGSATLIANAGRPAGGLIMFNALGQTGAARVEVFGNGTLDVSYGVPQPSIGSLEGDGLVHLGNHNLQVGYNSLSTTFSGVIADGGLVHAVNGSLTKVGATQLTLTNANTYTGGTAINGGTLLVGNTKGSGLGSGTVKVFDGTLGGNGIVSGSVIVGTGTGPGAFLAPAGGGKAPATFTISNALTLNADATYICSAKAPSSQLQVDQIVANGVTISGATFSFHPKISGMLQTGTFFTVISNTSANPISGTFGDLADGAIITVRGTNFQASYEGGDGNDLTLTVVP